MTDKEAIKYLQQLYPNGGHCWLDEQRIEAICMAVKALQEPVSEFLNTESMIESYKQRLISQANGMKNSPLIDMCLVSYKHGINETLDTLKLSNLVRFGKNWKESKFKVGDRIKFKGIHNEDVTRVITDIKEGDGDGFRYLFADGSIYSIGDDGIELVEEPVSEDLEEASKEWLRPKLDKSYANYGEGKMMELTRFDGYAMLDAIEFGAKWKEQQFEKNRLAHCDALTKEQAQIESNFVIQHLKKNNRTPTFIDAIEYGMKMQKKQMIKDAYEREVKVDAGGYPYIPQMELYDYDKDVPLAKKGDRVKVVVVKED